MERTTDPDLLTIQRRRRQQRRCLRCGAANIPRAALCARCQPAWRYCPRCERVYPVGEARDRRADRATAYCWPCGSARDRARNACDRATYLAARRARREQLLPAVIRGYRAGARPATIAAALGIRPGQVYKLASNARRDGRWPPDLTWKEHRRVDG